MKRSKTMKKFAEIFNEHIAVCEASTKRANTLLALARNCDDVKSSCLKRVDDIIAEVEERNRLFEQEHSEELEKLSYICTKIKWP